MILPLDSLTEDLLANGDYSWENSKYKQGTVSVDSNGILLKGTVKDNGLKFASYLGDQVRTEKSLLKMVH